MTQEPVTGAVEPTYPPPSPPPSPPAARGAPSFLPYALLAVIPAIIVGIVVYLVAGGGGSSGASGIVDGFIRLGLTSDQAAASYKGKLPPEFSKDFPLYPGSNVIASFDVTSKEGTNYFLVLGSSAKPEEIYGYYAGRLDKDPWQVEIARASSDFTGVRFSSPADANVQGDVTVHQSDLDNSTTIYVSFQDVSRTAAKKDDKKPFHLAASKSLPTGFPTKDIPLYKGKKDAEAVVTDTYLERASGNQNYIVSFLTKDTQEDVLKYYRDEFSKKSWTVNDSTKTSGLSRGIEFSDGPASKLSGTVRADTFDEDTSFTKVDLIVQVSTRSTKGN